MTEHDPLLASPLGKASHPVATYTPSLLYPIPRRAGREGWLDASAGLPFHGVDVWTLYELSWLDKRGKPVNALGQVVVPCQSGYLIESKSLKLYLGSFNQSRFGSTDEVAGVIERDLGQLLQSPVTVSLYPGGSPPELVPSGLPGECIDHLDIDVDRYSPDPGLLNLDGEALREECVYSELFRSLCPVTGQPDWASVSIAYRGRAIDHASLLRYLVSYRQHAGFHEQCVERVFVDIQQRCAPELLTVYARYLRRGGIDINPYRSTIERVPLVRRLIRQ